jgi:hypothetical protein
MKSNKINEDNPKIVVINITPANIHNSIKNTLHGLKADPNAANIVENLKKGDICIIRQVSHERRYSNGTIGIWYYYDKEDIEGKTEPNWSPSTGWKYKILMKPLVKQFKDPFFEEFSIDIPGQIHNKKSRKIDGLLSTDVQEDIQGAITIIFRDPDLPKRYLKAIIEEKNKECDIEMYYENFNNDKIKINVYEFLSDLIGEISYLNPNRGEISRRSSVQASTTRKKRSQKILQKNPDIDDSVEIDEAQQVEINKAGIGFCPICGTLLRPKTVKSGISVYFCKECNKGYKIKSK